MNGIIRAAVEGAVYGVAFGLVVLVLRLVGVVELASSDVPPLIIATGVIAFGAADHARRKAGRV